MLFSTPQNRLQAYRAERAKVLSEILTGQQRIAELDRAIEFETDLLFLGVGNRLDDLQIKHLALREKAGG